MKANIHPNYNSKLTIQCMCGNTFIAGSTNQQISIEICSACHPFFTGEVRLIDLAGRVDKYAAKLEKSDNAAQSRKKQKAAKRKTASDESSPTLKEMLQSAQKQAASAASSK